MRLCFLGDGRSIHMKKWMQYFQDTNEVHLISMDYRDRMLDMGPKIEVHLVPRKFPNFPFNGRLIKRLVEEIKPDILHAHFATHYGYWGARTGFHPFVLSTWGDDVLIHPRNIFLRPSVLAAIRGADLITTDGYNSRDAMIALQPKRTLNISIVSHGVKIRDYENHWNDLSNVVIYMRGFEPVYDWKTFVKVVPLVIKEIPEVQFLVLGGGHEEKKAKKALVQYSQVDWIGQVPHSVASKYLGMSDVYVSTAISEGGFALSMIEAMASGVVPVVTRVGDNAYAKGLFMGSVCSTDNPRNVANAIVYWLRNPNERLEAAKYNMKFVELVQDYRINMDKMDKLYRGLLK